MIFLMNLKIHILELVQEWNLKDKIKLNILMRREVINIQSNMIINPTTVFLDRILKCAMSIHIQWSPGCICAGDMMSRDWKFIDRIKQRVLWVFMDDQVSLKWNNATITTPWIEQWNLIFSIFYFFIFVNFNELTFKLFYFIIYF